MNMMNDIGNTTPEGSASMSIRIDKEGVWYYNGMEMFRKDIVNLLYEHLVRDESGSYVIEMGKERCVIEVEDAPYVVRAAYKFAENGGDGECIKLVMNDLSVEDLDPSSVWIAEDNVPYCTVKNGTFTARFSRAGYYQLAEEIEYDEGKRAFYILLNKRKYYLKNVEDCNAGR